MIDPHRDPKKQSFFTRYLRPLFFILILIGAVVVSRLPHGPCSSPLHYQIKGIDPKFGISTTTFASDVASAADIWNKALGKDLFVYDPKGSLTISLEYDKRQATTDRNKVLTSSIDGTTKIAESTRAEYLDLTDKYESMKADYDGSVTSFNKRAAAYEAEVASVNARGGASKTEYARLSAEKNALTTLQTDLENKRKAINDMASQINSFIDTYNILVAKINENVSVVNSTAGQQIEEGIYDPNDTSITIYEFSDKNKLIRVLAHELGHSLGLDHNLDPLSIMYKLNQANNLTLSSNDLSDLKTVCNIK
jgi:predicted Zn-dependent protease